MPNLQTQLSEGVRIMTHLSDEVVERVALIERLRGRAAFCRDRGEIKTPELLEEAAAAIAAYEAKGDIPTLQP